MNTNTPARRMERRHERRRPFALYICVLDDESDQTVGFLEEVAEEGFRLEANEPLPPQKELGLRMEVIPDVSDRLFVAVRARVKWCRPDIFRPDIFHVGFKITSISPHDREAYRRMLEKYGR